MATSRDHELTRTFLAGLENVRINYFDIMVIGNAGQGKSTTSDKIIIANPTGVDYRQAPPGNQPRRMTVDAINGYTDLSMWLVTHRSNTAEIDTHLKFLHYCRTREHPHKEINKVRSAATGANQVFTPTKDCEVLSNETSLVRLMDVPGFFAGANAFANQHDNPGRVNPSNAPRPDVASQISESALEQNNLDIMRRIIRIQTALSMKFNRILYFLPCRGPLESSNDILKLELKWMAHYFDRAIFKSMVLVATVSARFSNMSIPDEEKFPQEDIDMTKRLFRHALSDVFNNPPPNDPLPDPPLILISLTDTCEQILEKIKRATVQEERLPLQIDRSTCADCGVMIGMVKGQRVTCYFGQDIDNAIPYEESTCHPAFVPKYTALDKVQSGFKHILSLDFVRNPWPVFEGEKCISCGNVPNTRGCTKVNSTYEKGRQKILVDHTNQVVNALPEDEGLESTQDGQSSMVTTAQGDTAHAHSVCIIAEYNPNESVVAERAAYYLDRKGT